MEPLGSNLVRYQCHTGANTLCGEGQRRHTDRYFRGGSCYQRCVADALILDRSCRPIPPSPCYLVRRVVTYIHWNERRFALLSLSERRTPSVNIYSYREGKDTYTRFKLNKRCGPKSKFMFAEGKTKAPIYVIRPQGRRWPIRDA